MNTMKRFFSKALASMMLAGLCLCFVTAVSNAQCPTNIYPTSTDPGYTPWYNDGPTTDHIGSCEVNVYRCKRILLDGTIQYYIYKIVTLSNCDGLTMVDLVFGAENATFTDAVAGSGHPCGFGYYDVVDVYASDCWYTYDPSHGTCSTCYYESRPCDESVTCGRKCKVCIDAHGNASPYDCETTTYGTASSECIPLASPMVLGQCYAIGCYNGM